MENNLIMKEKWMVKNKKSDFSSICKEFGVTEVISRLLVNRGMDDNEKISKYLSRDINSMYSPLLMKDLSKACDILMKKINEGKKIRVIGDYDVDGIISTYILYSSLKSMNADIDYQIPDRMRDGYGINIDIINKAYKDDIDTIITCDNGISAAQQIEHAKSLGMTVIITDHHDVPDELPIADAVVNPKQEDCRYPFEGLCGAGVVYKLISELYDRTNRLNEINDYLQYVAAATVCDVMELSDENRIILKIGLSDIRQTKNLGLNALINVSQIDKSKLSTYHLGYIIGPCLNACGRLDTADWGIKLLMADNEKEAKELADELVRLNQVRKEMTQTALEQAVKIVENTDCMKDKILIIYLKDCHESLAGIIAGRLRERYHKPVIVLTKGEEHIKGSGRSIENYHMFHELNDCKELLLKFGGHPLAAGLSLIEENIDILRSSLNNNCKLMDDDLIPKVSIDAVLALSGIDEKLINDLEILEPFGKGNDKPLFADKDLEIIRLNVFGKNTKVLKLLLKDRFGTCIDAVYFGNIQKFLDEMEEAVGEGEIRKMYQGKGSTGRISITYYPNINEYNGNRSLQVVMQNYMIL